MAKLITPSYTALILLLCFSSSLSHALSVDLSSPSSDAAVQDAAKGEDWIHWGYPHFFPFPHPHPYPCPWLFPHPPADAFRWPSVAAQGLASSAIPSSSAGKEWPPKGWPHWPFPHPPMPAGGKDWPPKDWPHWPFPHPPIPSGGFKWPPKQWPPHHSSENVNSSAKSVEATAASPPTA